MEICLQEPTVSNSLCFPWQEGSLGRGGKPGCRLPTVGGNYRCLSPALQASRTSFPTGPPAVPLLCWMPPTSRPLPMPVLLPGVPSPFLYLTENSHLQSPTQEPAMPRSCPGLALPSPSLRFFVFQPRSASMIVPCTHVSAPLQVGALRGPDAPFIIVKTYKQLALAELLLGARLSLLSLLVVPLTP